MTSLELKALQSVRWVLLDFDGPVCSVFAGYPAVDVAAHLRNQASDMGIAVSADLDAETDPMEVLRGLYELAPDHHAEAEAALTAAEIQSVEVAEPTPGAIEFMRACRETGRPLAVVSNNSIEAIRRFLDNHALGSLVQYAVGRAKSSPRLMKPDPYLLWSALGNLSATPVQTALVGDSLTDIEAAHSVGAIAVGFANRLEKIQGFRRLGTEIITDDMSELTEAIKP